MIQPMPSLPGIPEQIARYQLLSELGRGSMGHVYLALDPNIDRKVALKLFLPLLKVGAAEQWELRQRFVLEARAAGQLSHPGIVTIFDADTDSDTGLSYLAMEWVNGPSLDDLIRESAPLSVERSMAIVEEVAEALYVAHRQGLVHRDIKPANILLESGGRAKVTDFGIAKLASMSITTTGWIPGSPFYMSPEQIRNENIDRRSDLYALGAVLYQCLTGRLPFEAESLAALTHMILEIDPRPVRSINPRVSPELAAVIDRALAKSPEDRFDSGREFARALQLARAGKFDQAPGALAAVVAAAPGAQNGVDLDGGVGGGTGTVGLESLAGEKPESGEPGPESHEPGAEVHELEPAGGSAEAQVDEAEAAPEPGVETTESGAETTEPTAAAQEEDTAAVGWAIHRRAVLVAGALLAVVLVAWGLRPVGSEPASAPGPLAQLVSSTPRFSADATSADSAVEIPDELAEAWPSQDPVGPVPAVVRRKPAAPAVDPAPAKGRRSPASPAAAVGETPTETAPAIEEAPLPASTVVARPPVVQATSKLEIVYRNRLRNAMVSVFIDERSVYFGSVEAQKGFFSKALGKNVWTALELTPGEHVVDVRITGEEGKTDMVRRTTAVFEQGRTHRLRVSVTPLKKLKLTWKESPSG